MSTAVLMSKATRGSTRGAWIGHRRGFTAVTTIAAVLVVGFAVCASAKVPAGRLAGLDPGARLGGDTIVATGRGEQIVGVPHRPNFIVALGSGETIAGGAGNEELGTLAENGTIRGGGGNDLLYGGRGATLIGGAGRNLIIDAKDDATVRLTSPGTRSSSHGATTGCCAQRAFGTRSSMRVRATPLVRRVALSTLGWCR
jgi:hypothetical protein